MSGGHWDYRNDTLSGEIFGWEMAVNYGERGFSQSKKAAKINPLEDHEISEILWDMLCILHSYDWYASGDTCKETYREDVEHFKKKWLGKTTKSRIQKVVDIELERAREGIYRTFGLECDKN